jgi:hypothetical protein
MFFTSIFCGSAVHILKDVIADSRMESAHREERSRFCSSFQGQIKAGSSPAQLDIRRARILY